MRDLANITHDGPKWIVLDGDIDPMWIESLNTVMDDNKVHKLMGCTLTPSRSHRQGEPGLWEPGPWGQSGAPHKELGVTPP